MSSRLDRLFILLESGSSQVTRKLAARQLGEVQLLHPHELHNLLKRTISLLRNSNWDTRIAAAQAIEAILSNLPKWDPQGHNSQNERSVLVANRLQLSKFDLEQILCAAPLSGSEGKEYDCEDDNSNDAGERILHQRQQLNMRLGFGNGNGILSSIDTIGNLVTNEDLKSPHFSNAPLDRKPIDDMVNSVLSSREINRARRKARQSAFSRSISNNGSRSSQQEEEEEPEMKKIKVEVDDNSCEGYGVPDGTGNWSDAVEWPLEGLCERLWLELFSPRWESRHGAATALREVLKVAIDGAGKSVELTKEQMEQQHQLWLEDAAVRLLWILALDRFGDFVSDQVVAPVRETCAQALGLILKAMNPAGVHSVLELLIQMLSRKEWETRHGGLLGIKYMLAVRQDLILELLPVVFPHIQKGLSDEMDDVGAVAASCLIPIADKLTMFQSELCPLVAKLWDLLLDQDELASACNSFMGLLAAILSLPEVSDLLQTQPLTDVIPRLWPFLSHNSSSVRCATLQTLCTLSQKSVKFNWPAALLQEALRHVFQRVLVEHVPEIQDIVEKVWNNLINNSSLDALLHAACPYVATWLCFTMHPARVAFDPCTLIHATSSKEKKNKLECSESINIMESQKYFLGGRETTPQHIREQNVIRARCIASRMLGELSQFLVKPAPGIEYPPDTDFPLDTYIRVMVPYLQSHSALQKLVASLVLTFWSRKDSNSRPCHQILAETLQCAMNQSVYYDEIAVTCTRLLQETRDFMAMLKHYKIEHGLESREVIPLEKIADLSGPTTQQLLIKCKLKPKVFESLEERRKNIHAAVTQTTSDQLMLNVSTMASIAGAATQLHCLPIKLNPLIKPLMESLKRETLEPLQQLSAEHLAVLTSLCLERNPCPNPKIVMNLCTFVRADAEFTPKIGLENENTNNDHRLCEISEERMIMSLGKTVYDGILTLTNQQRAIEKAAFRRNNSGTGRGPGRPPATDIPIEELIPVEDEATVQNRIQRKGGTFALKAIAKHFGSTLPTTMPKLWETMHDHLLEAPDPETFNKADFINNKTNAENLISNLQILEIVCGAIHNSLLPTLFNDLIPKLCMLLSHPFKAVRHMTARAMAALADLNVLPIMEAVIDKVIPMLGAIDCIMKRQGAAELIACVVEIIQVKSIPFVALLVVPLLGRMSDHDQSVRLMCTHSFANLIQLFPLEGRNCKDLPGASQKLNAKRKQHREFLEHLFQPKDIPEYNIPVPIKAELRSYQQAGVNWLAFLNKYRLHGVLCDDMGLGKTLQSICILAGDNYTREQTFKTTGSLDSAPLPNLVICPPTLTGHWVYEVKKFLPLNNLRPLQYAGPPVEREALRPKFKTHNLIVASYDIVRKDINFFSGIKWNYIILDEGHIIKNGKTKASKAVKQLIANHRLILSGTPIQNNVLELWSLFDFLMPGFLGTEKQFNAKYSRPILASRDPKSSPKEQEAGALAMEALHRQVLPFLLRRMKQDVLEDLPPKITQDYYCDLSPLQELLYEDFAKSHLAHSLQGSVDSAANIETPHVFQALRYLQNVCNHPKLVLTPGHPQYQRVMRDMVSQKSSLDDINHSAKLPALKQLLLDCGIGHPLTTPAMESCVNQHRALVFCQLKAVLDIIEKDLFKAHMPELTYLRLDGSIPPTQRHEVVTRFNNDPSIDVLLLTTQVGGLGLNLTGADTVVFVEHDWNPMRDLQAMDRAHRIGQKRVVNVYRLITRATLEERIMGLQKFKLLTANTVISGENATIETMGTDQILDLFSLSTNKQNSTNSEDLLSKDGHALTTKSVLKALPDLWQEKEYTEEYDITQYVNSLNKTNG